MTAGGSWRRRILLRLMEEVLRTKTEGRRKRRGNVAASTGAQPCATLSVKKIRIRPCQVPAREGIKAPRVTAHVVGRVTDSTNSPLIVPATFITIDSDSWFLRRRSSATICPSYWFHRVAHRRDPLQQRTGPRDLRTQRDHPSAQLRVGRVDQRRGPLWECIHQLHDSIICVIPTAMSSMNHGEILLRRRHSGLHLPIEHDRPYATVVEHQGGDLGDESSRGLGTVAPPDVRT